MYSAHNLAAASLRFRPESRKLLDCVARELAMGWNAALAQPASA
jgi:hypothetical protein